MAEATDKTKRRTRTVKKNPFVLVMRLNDDPPGHYRILASEVFDKTVAATKARGDVLKENKIDPEAVVKKHGGMRVAVCQFTDVVDFVPTLGFETKPVDPMDEIPTGAVQAAPAAAEVVISEEDATPPAEAEIPAEAPVVPPEDPPATSGASESESTTSTSESADSGIPKSPESSTDDSVDHAAPGAEGEEFWDGISESAVPDEPVDAEATPATVPPAEPAEGDDDLLF